jgi:hypothetical protein
MNTYKTLVKIRTPNGGSAQVWAQIQAKNPADARALMEAQHGQGNVIGAIVTVR